jgi:ribosomal protein S18 acetylase RimI-like enzyme
MSFEQEFRQLNEHWISRFFTLEDSDIELLSNPQKYILDKGGNVFIALQDGKVVGCCALLVHGIYTCELAKMVVDPKFQGQGIAYKLSTKLIEKAKERGFKRIILEGNTKMEASIALYRKLGFNETSIHNQTKLHCRCNVFMEMNLISATEPEFFI